MPRILRLPLDLANQIAAGEVVERPASVVKELVENAIDAGARRVSVVVELGGKRLVRVEDDGTGMPPEDAVVAVERHATSKIRRVEDLAAISTLGFRGEALPSIASVSHFTLRSRSRGTASGTEVRVNGGTVSGVAEVGMPEGTAVEVADLFYNLPARRKFLKADSAESAQVSRTLTQLALCYPEVGFSLTSSGRTVLQCPPVRTLGERLFQLYGERADLVDVHREGGDVRLTGHIAALAEQGPTRGPQHLFVNRRVVKDRTIMHAVIDAYSVASIKERSPEVYLLLELPPEAVDVNVHPAKAEVRFRDQSYIHQFVRRAIVDALGRGPAPALHLSPPRSGGGEGTTPPLPHAFPSVVPNPWAARASTRTIGIAPTTDGAIAPADSPIARTHDGSITSSTPSPIAPSLIPLGQFRDTFIIAVDDEAVVIVDQHVAHERVLFERMTERLTQGGLESQRLLEPMLLNLSDAECQALADQAEALVRLGFEVEDFGSRALRVSALPALLSRTDGEAALRALAADVNGLGGAAGVDEPIRRMAATMACHAAVKANDRLTFEKMAHILSELGETAHSTICPHGRPVMLRLSRREVEKNFQRI
jgi:DNA mismatch repair protein MutL